MQDRGLRKAALLVASLDQAAADLVLDQMDAQQAQIVRNAILELGPIDPQEQAQIVAEFHGHRRPGVQHPLEGIELGGQLAQRFMPPPLETPAAESAAAPLPIRNSRLATSDSQLPAPSGPPLGFLREAEADKLARVLATERPQTIAVVLSHMPPHQAGSVLARLGAELQVEVIRRLVDLEETDPETLRQLEQGLRSRLAAQVHMQRRRAAGLSAVSGILESCDPSVSGEILENLALHDRSLAERLGPRQLDFDELMHLDRQALGAVLRAADPEWVMLALIGATPGCVERLLTLLPEASAEQVRRELADPGPIRLSDVEEARQRLADLARRLALQGRIRLPHTSCRHVYDH